MTRFNATLLAAAYTAPFVSLLWYLLVDPQHSHWGLLAVVLFTTVPALIVCVLIIGAVGVPASLLLEKTGLASRGGYLLTGMALSTAGVGFVLLYDWCCLPPGPFNSSFQQRIDVLGPRAVGWDYLRALIFAIVCGGIAANFFRSALLRQRSNQRLERP